MGYNPNQSRANDGKWGSGGGSSQGKSAHTHGKQAMASESSSLKKGDKISVQHVSGEKVHGTVTKVDSNYVHYKATTKGGDKRTHDFSIAHSDSRIKKGK